MICKLVILKNNYNKIQSKNNNHQKKQKNLIVNVILFVKRNSKFYIVLIMIFRRYPYPCLPYLLSKHVRRVRRLCDVAHKTRSKTERTKSLV